MSDAPDLPPDPEPEAERGDVRDDVTKELARLFPEERMTRIVERLGIDKRRTPSSSSTSSARRSPVASNSAPSR
ncbi:MAG: hypothetical protein KY463_04620 [Actinobacteria bacterium]|nr:hypothetical protein [Actinomycetota bacterium]